MKTFTCITYNIHKGFDFLGIKYTLKSLKKALIDEKIDFCMLQEVIGENTKLNKKYTAKLERQLEYLADSVWKHYSYGKNAVFKDAHHGNALLSQFPIQESKNINLTLHPLEQRGLLHCIVVNPEDLNLKIHILTVHLNLRKMDRFIQMKKIKDYIDINIPSNDPILFAGDFNDWNFQIDQYIEENLNFKNAYFEKHQNHPKTFPNIFPILSLDRIYYRNLKIIQCEVIRDESFLHLSDHLPIKCEFLI